MGFGQYLFGNLKFAICLILPKILYFDSCRIFNLLRDNSIMTDNY
jgi:hypothetical protein